MTDELSSLLERLSLQELDFVQQELDRMIAERKSRITNPGAASLNDLAISLGLDLAGLKRDINRKA